MDILEKISGILDEGKSTASCPQCGAEIKHSPSATKVGCGKCKLKATKSDADDAWKWQPKKK